MPTASPPTSTHTQATPSGADASLAAEFLTFRIGAEEYGIDILRTQEIRGYTEPTRLAHAPGHIKGVVNLRGVIVPIVELRLLLGEGEPMYDAMTVVIVLNVDDRVVGLVVDSVTDVATLNPEHMHPVPPVEQDTHAGLVMSIASLAERMLLLVDVDRLLERVSPGQAASLPH